MISGAIQFLLFFAVMAFGSLESIVDGCAKLVAAKTTQTRSCQNGGEVSAHPELVRVLEPRSTVLSRVLIDHLPAISRTGSLRQPRFRKTIQHDFISDQSVRWYVEPNIDIPGGNYGCRIDAPIAGFSSPLLL